MLSTVSDPPAPAAYLPGEPERFFCAVTPYFQPIVRTADLSLVAYEALSRGPRGTPLHDARTLFAAARTMGREAALERVCWAAAVLNATRNRMWSRGGALLFLNVSPERILEPAFLAFARRLVRESALDPRRVVIEITEDSLLRADGRFLDALLPYRELGFRVAVDDLGGGTQDLRVLAEIRPDFVKVARELAAGVHRHAGRRTVVQGLVSLTSALGATLVVEGVETGEELEVLREMGVDCVQGYLLGRPAATMGATLPVPLALRA